MEKVKKKCKVCKKEFLVHAYRKDTAKYCSHKCRHKGIKGIRRTTLEHRKKKDKEHNRTYYLKHKEKIMVKQKEYIKANPEVKKRATKNYYWKHKEKEQVRKKTPEYKKWAREYYPKYKKANPEKVKEWAKKYFEKNVEKIKAYRKEYQRRPERKEWMKKYKAKPEVHERYMALSRKWKKTPKGRANARFYNQRRRILKKGIVEGYTKTEFLKLVKNTKGVCPVCLHPFTITHLSKHELTLDHHPPISKVPKGFVYTIDMINPLCRSCNSKKGNRELAWKLEKEKKKAKIK